MVAPAPPHDELVHLGLSPWSLHARWALAALGHPVMFTPYAPGGLDELRLRARLRFPPPPISVPVLFRRRAAGGGAVRGAEAIARYAQAQVADAAPATAAAGAGGGAGVPASRPHILFPPVPPGGVDEVAAWATAAQEVLSYFRAAIMAVAASGPVGASAMAAVLPPALRSYLPAPVVRWMAGHAAARMVAKYPPLVDRTTARTHMDRLAAAVSAGGAGSGSDRSGGQGGCVYLVGGAFSYADIAMVIATGVVRPLGERILDDAPLAAVKALAADKEFGAGLEAVVAWRDAILAAHFADDSLAGGEGRK